VTYAAKISKEEAKLDFTLPAVEVWRKVRAFNPFPGAQGTVNGTVVKIWAAEPAEGDGTPGQVLSADAAGIVVACGTGALRLLQLQKPGGKRLAAAEFLKAFELQGLVFE
jgi:methionyl-tRNA formyltransferase